MCEKDRVKSQTPSWSVIKQTFNIHATDRRPVDCELEQGNPGTSKFGAQCEPLASDRLLVSLWISLLSVNVWRIWTVGNWSSPKLPFKLFKVTLNHIDIRGLLMSSWGHCSSCSVTDGCACVCIRNPICLNECRQKIPPPYTQCPTSSLRRPHLISQMCSQKYPTKQEYIHRDLMTHWLRDDLNTCWSISDL